MEKSGSKLDTFQMREKDFNVKSELFSLIAETEERNEYNTALQVFPSKHSGITEPKLILGTKHPSITSI